MISGYRGHKPARRLTSSSLTLLFFAFAVGLIFWAAPAIAQTVRVENPNALPVIDKANLLTPEQISNLNVRLRTLADTDGTQIAVLTVPTTGDEDIFMFAQRTFTEWGIGQKANGNGAIFVIASNDRKTRIHTGYGLEGRLTDALSKRIIETEVTPQFRKGDFYQGISNGVDAMIKAVRGEYKAPVRENPSSGSNRLLTLIIIAFVIFMIYRAMRGGGGGPGGGLRRRRSPFGGPVMLPNVWTTGGHSSGGWGHSSGDGGGGFSGGFGGGFGGGSSGGGGASGSW